MRATMAARLAPSSSSSLSSSRSGDAYMAALGAPRPPNMPVPPTLMPPNVTPMGGASGSVTRSWTRATRGEMGRDAEWPVPTAGDGAADMVVGEPTRMGVGGTWPACVSYSVNRRAAATASDVRRKYGAPPRGGCWAPCSPSRSGAPGEMLSCGRSICVK